MYWNPLAYTSPHFNPPAVILEHDQVDEDQWVDCGPQEFETDYDQSVDFRPQEFEPDSDQWVDCRPEQCEPDVCQIMSPE